MSRQPAAGKFQIWAFKTRQAFQPHLAGWLSTQSYGFPLPKGDAEHKECRCLTTTTSNVLLVHIVLLHQMEGVSSVEDIWRLHTYGSKILFSILRVVVESKKASLQDFVQSKKASLRPFIHLAAERHNVTANDCRQACSPCCTQTEQQQSQSLLS